MIVRTSLLAFSLLCVGFAVPTHAAESSKDWPQWRGPNRDGKSSETGLLASWEEKKPKLLWMGEGLGQGYASVSIVGDKLYTTGNFDDGQAVVCFDLSQQQVAWKQNLTSSVPEHGYTGSRCTPTIDGEDLYAEMSDGTIGRLDRESGKVYWKKNLTEEYGASKPHWGFAESPLVDGERLICGAGSKEALLVCLNKKTGEEIWVTPLGESDLGEKGKDEAGYSSTLVCNAAGKKQYVKLIGRGVVGVDAENGKLLWSYNHVANNTANIPDPIIDGDYVFTSTGYGTGAALLHLTNDGGDINAEEVYFLNANIFQNHHGGMIKVGDYIYAGTKHNKGFPTCVEMKSGEIQWGGDIRPEGKGSAAVTYADGNLIFRYQDGTLALIEANPKEYVLKGTFKPEYQERESWSHPVVLDGKLYLREQDKLMCYDLTP
ncbi:polyvinylalcohol dehydrogenase [Bremerella cremea]|uniref:Polyvinylalcohol dehydrogenase n=1 Tax=Blastopirellula marina TaxID=124 RepID=A0A2S8FFQ9_9BACT|nr:MULTISPECIES: PQQ-binding-like beta-propeller repeat protein [Pirellulaceae]PQO31009.1 polyvinylalcohol dehydrogenase [Blastopirellula marina]RCS44156.1 polyvinylalcohol dehydrogenase [Bremerella cremea]